VVLLPDVAYFALAFAELLLIAAIGLVVGKLIHKSILFAGRKLASSTKTTLDDLVLASIEGPLEVGSVLLILYVLSAYFEKLDFVRDAITAYSLAGLIILAAYAISEILGALLRWYYVEGKTESKLKVDVTLLPFARKVTRITIIFVGITMALSVIGFDVSGLLAVASVTALILGLASQETLGNVFAGIALQLDRQYSYGDYVRFVNGDVARLKKIGLRSTRLDDLGGNTIVISNSELAKQRVTNLSRPTQEETATFSFEMPFSKTSKFEKHITSAINASKISGLAGGCETLIEKLGKETATVIVEVKISDYAAMKKLRDYANRKAMEFLQKK